MNPKTGGLELKWVPRDEAKREVTREGLVIDYSKIIGRVTLHEMPAIHNFHESDFAPVGTRPGISAGVPLGKRAYTFNASGLDGCVYQLKQGDHVDLMVSVPVDMPGGGRSGPMGGSVVATPDTLLRPKRTLEIPLVQDGVVVSPVTPRVTQATSSSIMNGATIRNMRVEEIVIAVAPAEVAPLDEAKALKHKLTCVARSGLPESVPAPVVPPPAGGTAPAGIAQVAAAPGKAIPDKDRIAAGHLIETDSNAGAPGKTHSGKDSAAAPNRTSPPPGQGRLVNPMKGELPAKDRVALDIMPGLNPMAEVRFMEVMIGTKRQFVLFNGPGNSPVVAAQNDGADSAAPAASPVALRARRTRTKNRLGRTPSGLPGW